MSIISSVLGSGVLGSVDSILGRFFGNKDLKETNIHDEEIALRSSVTGEFSRTPTSMWDSFVDGINRLVRPIYTFGIIAQFVWCIVDPIAFTQSMQALSLVPEALWMIEGTIVVFWFGSRGMELKMKAKSKEEVQSVMQSISTLQEMKDEREKEYSEVMKNTQPLPNQEILTWKLNQN
jgi:hypothetical protein